MGKPASVEGGGLIRCQSDRDDYAGSCGRVAMSGDDGMDSRTQEPVVRCMWVPAATSCHVRPSMALLSKHLVVAMLTRYWRVSGRDYWGSVLCRVMRRVYSGQTCGKILPIRGHCDGRDDRYGSFLSLVLFRLTVPPLQSGVLGPYLVWCAWFLNRLPLEGTGRI
jgi:hypothetical protein